MVDTMVVWRAVQYRIAYYNGYVKSHRIRITVKRYQREEEVTLLERSYLI